MRDAMRRADFTDNLLHSALASMVLTDSGNRCRTVSLMRKQKILVIGFQKTGTSSLGAALEILGYSVCDAVGIHDIKNEADAKSIALPCLDKYDAFQDNPWPILYLWLHHHYPDASFIHTVRDEDSWISSVVRHFSGRSTAMRQWIYTEGDPAGNEEIYLQRYRRHNDEVAAYFAGNAGNYLRMDLAEDDNWAPLCDLLDCKVPRTRFPHMNSAGVRENRLLNGLQRRFYRLRTLIR